jgi:hypothetical protein
LGAGTEFGPSVKDTKNCASISIVSSNMNTVGAYGKGKFAVVVDNKQRASSASNVSERLGLFLGKLIAEPFVAVLHHRRATGDRLSDLFDESGRIICFRSNCVKSMHVTGFY